MRTAPPQLGRWGIGGEEVSVEGMLLEPVIPEL